MHEFTRKETIHANIESVWQALSDIGNIDQWSPGVVMSKLTPTQQPGHSDNNIVAVGSTRHCDLGKGRFLEEVITEFEPLNRITFRIHDTNLPFTSADIRFKLTAISDRQTEVEVSPHYQLKYGSIGRALNFLLVQRSYQKGMRALLAGLKTQLETD